MASSTLLDHRLTLPDESTATQAGVAADLLKQFLLEHPNSSDATVRLVADTADTTVEIPGEALVLLADVLAQIANGNAVTIAPVHAELTTQQAADLLGVSRPYLVKLLEERKIPHRRVGNRRRVMLTDLVAYKRIDDAERMAVADELTAEAQRLGLYT
ncbi:MAG: excisionase family DNA-binding protein [Acidimicrobiia bacterium]|nr:excisionase family DNA-binding protein [Actinomycetota bacterium]MBL6925462.1 excisionase family DNA-binding protein [Acidimicrobiia bacterium]MBL6927382.1 excisionase family DNA-binding protein [Acidimicrobiia bacterium]